MSEILATDLKSITARNFADEGFREADIEFVESGKDNKRVEADFSRVYELNKWQDRVHHVWYLDSVNTKVFLRGFRTIKQFTALAFFFFLAALKDMKPCLGLLRFLEVSNIKNTPVQPKFALYCQSTRLRPAVLCVCAGEDTAVCRRRRHYLWSRPRHRGDWDWTRSRRSARDTLRTTAAGGRASHCFAIRARRPCRRLGGCSNKVQGCRRRSCEAAEAPDIIEG